MTRELMHMCVEVIWTAVQREECHESINAALGELTRKLRDEAAAHREVEEVSANAPDYQSFPAYAALTERWGNAISIPKLSTLAFCVAEKADIAPPSRAERRKKGLLFCWFHRNWEIAVPILKHIDLDEKDSP